MTNPINLSAHRAAQEAAVAVRRICEHVAPLEFKPASMTQDVGMVTLGVVSYQVRVAFERIVEPTSGE